MLDRLAETLLVAEGCPADPAGIEDDLRLMLAEAAAADALDALAAALGPGAVVALTSPAPAGAATDLDLTTPAACLTLDYEGRAYEIGLAVPPAPPRGLLERWRARARDLGEVSVPAALRLGLTRLPAAETGRLRRGDVVLFETGITETGVVFVVIAERLIARAGQTPDGLLFLTTIKTAPRCGQEGWTMHSETTHGDGEIADLDAVPVTLSFEIGRIEIPLGLLRTIDAGFVLDLNLPAGGATEIRVNGCVIGRGCLVDIEGRLGVRIDRINADA